MEKLRGNLDVFKGKRKKYFCKYSDIQPWADKTNTRVQATAS